MACDFDPILACDGAKGVGCLDKSQAEAIKTAFAGPKTSAGSQVFSAFPYDVGGAENLGLPGLLMGPTIPVRGATSGTSVFNVDRDAERIDGDANAGLGDSTWTSLSTFVGRGRRLLFFHSVSDPWFSAFETLAFYQDDCETRSASRGPLEPTLPCSERCHCGCGSTSLDRFDMLTRIVDWVEKNDATEAVIATGAVFPGRSRPLCPTLNTLVTKARGIRTTLPTSPVRNRA